MPVEIKELIIRAVAEVEQEEDRAVPTPALSSTDTEAIVEVCVKQILRILKKSKKNHPVLK